MAMNIAQFYDKVNADPLLQKRIMEGTGFEIEAVLKNSVKIGAEMGYEFSLEEAQRFGAALEDLPDEMLDMVSAGAPTRCNPGVNYADTSSPT